MTLAENTLENHSQVGCGVEWARLVISSTIPRLAWPAILAQWPRSCALWPPV